MRAFVIKLTVQDYRLVREVVHKHVHVYVHDCTLGVHVWRVGKDRGFNREQ